MKKNFLVILLTFMLALTCVGPVPAFAANLNTQSNSSSVPLADEFIYYFKTVDGKKYYRIWNATDLRWETPWLPCG